MKRPSIRVHENLLDAFDEWVNDFEEFDSRTQALRSFMRDAIDGQPGDDVMPLLPPAEQRFAVACRKLCQAAYPNGIVRDRTAERVRTNGPQNLSKQEVPALVLHPLGKQGSIRQQTDPLYGNTSWEIVAWEK